MHGEDRPVAVPQALTGAVVEVRVRRLPAERRHRVRFDGEAVVLRGDLDLPGGEVLDRVVGAVVAERQLERAPAGRQAEDLMAEADAEDRHATEQPADRLDQVGHALRISRPVGEEHPIGLRREDVRRGRRRRHDGHGASARAELAQNVELDAAVVRDDPEAWRGRRHVTARELPAAGRPGVGRVGRDFGHQVAADEPGQGPGALEEASGIGLDRGDDAVLGAVVPQVARQRARVDVLDTHDAVAPEVLVEARAGAEVRRDGRRLFDDEPVDPRPPRLLVLLVDAVVADHRVGHRDDLPSIRRIGQDLLIPLHGGIEDDLTRGFSLRAERPAPERAPVAQHEPGLVGHELALCTSLPPTSVIHGPPRSVQPPNGVLRLRDWNRDGSTVASASGSRIVTSAGAPTASVPPGRLSSRAGSRLQRAISVASGRSPGRTSRSSTTATAASSPTTPKAARSNSPSFSESACGAWSVAMQSTVPSASASISASTSRLVRSGGAIFVFGSQVLTASSVSTRWCGVTSAVTRTPRAFASRTRRTAPTVETWAM